MLLRDHLSIYDLTQVVI